MKKLIFLSVIFISQIVFAQNAANCNMLNPPNQAQQQNCETINKLGECKEAAPVDENAIRNRLMNLFKISEDPKTIERLARNWPGEIKNNPYLARMYPQREDYENQQKLAPTPIMDWMSSPKYQSQAKSKAELQEGFIQKYIDYAKKMDCTPTFYASDRYFRYHPTVKGFSTQGMSRDEKDYKLKKLNEEVNKPENVQAAKDFLKKIADASPNEQFICSDRVILEPTYTVGQNYEPCAGNFKKNFENNKYEIPDADLSKLLATPEASSLSACIKDRLAKGAKLHHVSIDSSASSLNNTGDAAKRFCKKGFLGLSEARAETARKQIVPKLFSDAGMGPDDINAIKIDVNAKGANGDGTSGPCVYETKNGKEVLKAKYNTKAGQAELDENRYVKVQVTFEEAGVTKKDNIAHYNPRFNCRKVVFKCQ